jgi:hypothetical protein
VPKGEVPPAAVARATTASVSTTSNVVVQEDEEASGEAQDPADLVAVRPAQEGEVEARKVLVAVQRSGLVHDLGADVRAALPEAELGTDGVPGKRHAALVHDVHRPPGAGCRRRR